MHVLDTLLPLSSHSPNWHAMFAACLCQALQPHATVGTVLANGPQTALPAIMHAPAPIRRTLCVEHVKEAISVNLTPDIVVSDGVDGDVDECSCRSQYINRALQLVTLSDQKPGEAMIADSTLPQSSKCSSYTYIQTVGCMATEGCPDHSRWRLGGCRSEGTLRVPRQGCLVDQSFLFDGSTSRRCGCLKDTSAKCTLISNEVTVHEYLKICNTVPQLHPSAAVATYAVTRA
jgi:hypothetical protein